MPRAKAHVFGTSQFATIAANAQCFIFRWNILWHFPTMVALDVHIGYTLSVATHKSKFSRFRKYTIGEKQGASIKYQTDTIQNRSFLSTAVSVHPSPSNALDHVKTGLEASLKVPRPQQW